MPNLAEVRAILIDMDGVLYLADQRLPGAARLLGWLQERSFPFLLVTNNASLTPQAYAAKLQRLEMPAPPEQVLTSDGGPDWAFPDLPAFLEAWRGAGHA